jgi:Planctomycete extracellular
MVSSFHSGSRRPKVPAVRRHRRRLKFEVLEPRQLLSTVDWISKTSGDWNVGSNWSTGTVPGTGDDVVIDVSGATPTITIGTGNQSVLSLTAADPMLITGGSLLVAADSTITGGLSMTGG